MSKLIMPFGKHKGKDIEEVPDDYLLWLLDQCETFGELNDYLKENEDAIRKGAKEIRDEYYKEEYSDMSWGDFHT